MQDYEGKCVVVTGGSSGIGLAMAKAFASHGASVIITGRSAERLSRAADACGRITPFVCDVTSDAEVLLLREKLDGFGGLDVLVNNAGVMHAFDITAHYPLSAQMTEIAIDVEGPVRMVHHFLPGMLKRASTIINVSSGLAYVPYAAAPIYSGAKSFLHSYTQCLRGQLKGTSVRVVELLPPVIDTPLAVGLAPEIPRMSPEVLVKHLMRGLKRGQVEIAPGMSWRLKLLSRLTPGLGFRLLNADSLKERQSQDASA